MKKLMVAVVAVLVFVLGAGFASADEGYSSAELGIRLSDDWMSMEVLARAQEMDAAFMKLPSTDIVLIKGGDILEMMKGMDTFSSFFESDDDMDDMLELMLNMLGENGRRQVTNNMVIAMMEGNEPEDGIKEIDLPEGMIGSYAVTTMDDIGYGAVSVMVEGDIWFMLCMDMSGSGTEQLVMEVVDCLYLVGDEEGQQAQETATDDAFQSLIDTLKKKKESTSGGK